MITLLTVVALATASLEAAPTVQLNEAEQQYLGQSILQRAALLVLLEKEILGLQKQRTDISRASVTSYEGRSALSNRVNVRPGRFNSKAEKDKALKGLQDRISSKSQLKRTLEDPKFFYSPVILNFAVGAIGKLTQDDRVVRIVQVLGPGQMIVEIDDNWVMLKGFKTEGLVDGKVAQLSDIIHIDGTYRYTTVMGASKTIFKAVPFDDSRVRAYVESTPNEIQSRIEKAVTEAKAAAKEPGTGVLPRHPTLAPKP